MGIKENRLQGDGLEVQFEHGLSQALPYNYGRSELHANVKPDFAVFDNDGGRLAFIEVKSGNKAGTHDMEQTLEAIKQTGQMTETKTIYVIAQDGFFNQSQTARITECAKQNEVRVQVLNAEDMQAATSVISSEMSKASPGLGKTKTTSGSESQGEFTSSSAKVEAIRDAIRQERAAQSARQNQSKPTANAAKPAGPQGAGNTAKPAGEQTAANSVKAAGGKSAGNTAAAVGGGNPSGPQSNAGAQHAIAQHAGQPSPTPQGSQSHQPQSQTRAAANVANYNANRPPTSLVPGGQNRNVGPPEQGGAKRAGGPSPQGNSAKGSGSVSAAAPSPGAKAQGATAKGTATPTAASEAGAAAKGTASPAAGHAMPMGPGLKGPGGSFGK
jgi:hypothetical protein